MQITPAILPHDFGELTEKLSCLEGLASHVQIDLCDGVFGREKTWMPEGTEVLPAPFTYEFDVMMDDWRETILHCLSLNATGIVAHVDLFKEGDMETLVSIVSPHRASLGISVSNDKSLEFHADMIRKALSLYGNVFIQVMGIKTIGEQGMGFDEETPFRVKTLKDQFSDMHLQVDGGIKPATAHKVQESGADAVVVGSYLFGSDDIFSALEALNLATPKP